MFRLLGLLGGLSVATDLGSGAPIEESLRRCVVATRLARSIGCDDSTVGAVIYTSLLQHLGCTAYSHEAARAFGDDITSTRLAFLTDFTRPADVLRTWVTGMASSTGQSRTRVLSSLLTAGRRVDAAGPVATCEVARDAARRLGLPPSVQEALHAGLTMWNGEGYPATAGDAIPLTTRIMHVASTAALFSGHAGTGAAVAEVGRRSGVHLDPLLAECFRDRASELLDGLEELDAYRDVLNLEPDPVRLVGEPDVEAVAWTFGDVADLKSPWLQGHSASVGVLAAASAAQAGLTHEVTAVRLAGALHDLGRVAVSSRIWDKPGPLNTSEWDQVRLHAYHTERILARVPELAHVATLAGQHHERSDGSGYHRGAPASGLSMASRVLAAADAYRSLVEDRPYRAARSAGEAASALRDEARQGRLDGDAVVAVLNAAGQRPGRRRDRPAGLTARQIEVLRLLAAGRSNREIADTLVISRRTAEHHVQDVYLRIGASSRAAAALFAMEHGLLERAEPEHRKSW